MSFLKGICRGKMCSLSASKVTCIAVAMSMVVTNKTEQGRQYKEYTREATGNKAERSAQLLGGEFLDEPSGKAERWYE